MGKKKLRDKYTSKGERRSVAKHNRTPMPKNTIGRLIRQRDAWKEGKSVVITMANPNPNETNKKFIRVNARELWGDPKKQRAYSMKDA